MWILVHFGPAEDNPVSLCSITVCTVVTPKTRENVFFNPNPSRSQLFIAIPGPAPRFSEVYSHSLPSPIHYSHASPILVSHIALVAVFRGHHETNNQ